MLGLPVSTSRDLVVEPCSRRKREDGSALLLIPAMVLIVVAMSLLTINSALTFLARQEIDRLASAAANDAVSGIGASPYFRKGSYNVLSATAESLGSASLAARVSDSVRDPKVEVVVVDGDTVVVTASGLPRSLVSKLLPWSQRRITVVVSADAVSQ